MLSFLSSQSLWLFKLPLLCPSDPIRRLGAARLRSHAGRQLPNGRRSILRSMAYSSQPSLMRLLATTPLTTSPAATTILPSARWWPSTMLTVLCKDHTKSQSVSHESRYMALLPIYSGRHAQSVGPPRPFTTCADAATSRATAAYSTPLIRLVQCPQAAVALSDVWPVLTLPPLRLAMSRRPLPSHKHTT